MIYIFAAPGRVIRDPVSHALVPEAGRFVPQSAFWLRRLRDGDVCQAEPPAPAVTVSDQE